MGDFVFLIILFSFMYLLVRQISDNPKPTSADNKLVIHKKKCPPHEWFWQEIVDQNGDKQGQRIVCKVCGPIRSSE